MATQLPIDVAALRCSTLPFDRFPMKVRVPAPRPGSVSRTGLVNRLRAAHATPVVTIVAPAGYGKTTALAQWAARDERPFAWLSIDERDDEPAVLLRHLAAALDGCEPLDASILDAVGAPGPSIWTSAVPQLATALASLETATVLVLDDAALLRSPDSLELLNVLVQHVPEGSTLALSGRETLPLPIAALRAGGRMLEIGTELLAFGRREAEALLRTSGVELTREQSDCLLERTEGWAAGLYLSVLAIRDGGTHDGAGIEGDDRYLADYFRSTCLAGLSPARLDFLRRTSVLDWLSGPLCDAILETADSALELEALEAAGLFLAPLDRRRSRYRYHPLFRDALRSELAEFEPSAVATLHRRAASWFDASGEPCLAIEHALAAGDVDVLAHLVGSVTPRECHAGRVEAIETRLGVFQDADLERHAPLAAAGAWVHAIRGRAWEAERWLAAAESGTSRRAQPVGGASVRASVALVRAALCRDGVEQMLLDAEIAAAGLPPGDGRRAQALVVLGAAQLIGGSEPADDTLQRAAEKADARGATGVLVGALAERALLAAASDDPDSAERLSLEARAFAAGTPLETAFGALAAAVSARALLRRAHWDDARAELDAAERLRPTLTRAIPWLAIQTLVELAQARLTLRDLDSARSLEADASAILRTRPDLGRLAADVEALRVQIDSPRALRAGTDSRLTSAELRLLPLLATHLSFREIGAQLYVSRNTIKTQAISVYRKLGVSSRSDAIAEATSLGLLAAPPAR